MLHLREIRLSKGYSVQKLSDVSGIHRRTIQDIEKRGDCMISTAYILANILGVTLNDLYTKTESWWLRFCAYIYYQERECGYYQKTTLSLKHESMSPKTPILEKALLFVQNIIKVVAHAVKFIAATGYFKGGGKIGIL